MKKLLIYGANGYTGKLILQQALRQGLLPVIAGRNKKEIEGMAAQSALEARIFDLEKINVIAENLSDVDVVIHAAGPFNHTAKKMLEACLQSKTHYTDITGEIEVFEMCASYGSKGSAANITIMPGVGFDVVPSDCLAAHLKRRLPDASELQLAFAGLGGGISRGTAKTMIENLGRGGAVRRNEKITVVPNAYKTMEIDFGGGKKILTATIPWGDVSTAWHSTGIPNIEVYNGVTGNMVLGMRVSNIISRFLKTTTVRNYLKKKIDKRAPGPSDEKRQKGRSLFWGKVKNKNGKTCVSIQQTPDGYTLTAMTSIAIAKKILDGNFKSGFQTPSMAYGADLILEIENCKRQDVE